ncbi:hypothetical protein PTT_16223, partial [Pyrenophora teres f. teres 0-1]
SDQHQAPTRRQPIPRRVKNVAVYREPHQVTSTTKVSQSEQSNAQYESRTRLQHQDKDNYGHSNSNDKTRDSKCVKRDGFLDGKTLYDGKEDTTTKSEGSRGYCIIEDEGNDGLMIRTSELLDHLASPEKMIQDIEQILPEISPNRPEIKEFIERLSKLPFTPHYTPVKEKHPSDWSFVSLEIESWWDDAINQEPRPTNTPEWIPAAASARVKPVGSLQGKLMVVTCYPPISSIHPRFATVDDLSCESISDLYTKLGYHTQQSADASESMLHLDCIPIQMGRQGTLTLMENIPKEISTFWENANTVLFEQSQARIVLIFGQYPAEAYIRSLRKRKILFRAVQCAYTESLRPTVLFEYDRNGMLTRMAFLMSHPERFRRYRSHVVGTAQRLYAIQERILDLAASVLLKRGFITPTLLASREIFRSFKSGIYIHASRFLASDQELAELFRYPMFRTTHHLHFIESCALLLPHKKKIMGIINANRVAFKDGPRYWQHPQRVVEYGPHAITFELLAIEACDLHVSNEAIKAKKKREDKML